MQKWNDVNNITSLLKLFLRKLPEGLVTAGNFKNYGFSLISRFFCNIALLKVNWFLFSFSENIDSTKFQNFLTALGCLLVVA